MKYKLIVFDWDGTLMDSIAKIVACMRISIKQVRLPHRDDSKLRDIIGLGLQEAITSLYPDITTVEYESLVDCYRNHFLFKDDTPSVLFSGAHEMMADLNKQGYYLAVATSKGRVGLDLVLNETNMGAHFHATRCADEAFSKPHPKMLLDIMDELGVDADETLMVGDTEYDLQMAQNARCDSLGISHGVHPASRLEKLDPVACVEDLHAMRNWFAAIK